MKKQEERQGRGNTGSAKELCALLKGGVLAAAVSIFVLLLCAVLGSMGILKEDLLDGCVLLSCVSGGLIGGLYAVKGVGRAALPVGLAAGGMLFLLLLTGSLIFYDGAGIEQSGLQILASCLCGGAAAGILGKKRSRKKRK